VRSALAAVTGVAEAQVMFEGHEALVRYDAAQCSISDLIAAVAAIKDPNMPVQFRAQVVEDTRQVQPGDTPSLAALDPFIGRWRGTTEGQPGKGTVEREYTRVLKSRFVRATNRSAYPPQDRNPKGEEHEDVGLFSVDRARKRIVLRQFHVEGFVNQYVQEGGTAAGTLVFVTESIENIPAGWRARETYTWFGPDEFEEVFELAAAGKPFEVYSRARLTRVK
jgi:hypothetical protein